MNSELIAVSPTARDVLLELAARTGRSAAELLEEAVKAYRRQLADESPPAPVDTIPGVNPADVWAAAAEADDGKLAPHADVFARLRGRS